MRNTNKIIFAVFMIFSIVFSMSFSSHAVIQIPEKIRVGLLYNDSYSKTAAESFTASAEKGLQLGFYKDGKFNIVYEYASASPINIRKDSYFVNDGGIIKEYSPDSALIPPGDKIGPFHIQIGGIQSSITEANNMVADLKAKGIMSYLSYTDGYSVWTGFFTDEASAQSFMADKLAALDNTPGSIVQASANAIVAENAAKETLFVFDSKSAFFQIHPKKENNPYMFMLNGKSNYRGDLEVRRLTGSDMTVINILPMDSYLYGVVPSEIEASSNPEALKAQAVAARTYTLTHMGRHSDLYFDLCPTVACQVYKGKDKEDPRTNNAVDETTGKKIVYNNALAQVFYFSSSGGRTEDPKNVWGGEIPYLKSVDDKYESGKSWHYNWEVSLTTDSINQRMKQLGYNIGNVVNVNITSVSDAGRATELVVQGSKDKAVFQREKARTVFSLDSQLYKITTDADASFLSSDQTPFVSQLAGKKVITASGIKTLGSFGKSAVILGANNVSTTASLSPTIYKFTGKGWGHAVGMSQEGAKGMANAGFTYEEILKHYFIGINIE